MKNIDNIVKEDKSQLKNCSSIKNRISFDLGANMLESCGKYDPKVHFINIENNYTHTEYTITIYCERPGLLIGKYGSNVDELKIQFKQTLKTDNVSVNFVEYIPVLYPIYDLD